MGNKGKKGKRIKIISIVLVLCILFGAIVGTGFLAHYKGAPIINDLTTPVVSDGEQGNAENPSDVSTDDDENVSSATLSQSVQIYDTNESKKITENIVSIYELEEDFVFDVKDGSPLESLGKGDIFFIQGDKDSVFGEAYFGKIAYVVDEDGYSRYVVETPMLDEVFDEIDIDYSQVMGYDNISDAYTYEGVTISRLDDISALFEDSGDTVRTGSFSVGTSSSESSTASSETEIEDGISGGKDESGIHISFEIDLLKYLQKLGKNTSSTVEKNPKVTKGEASQHTVWYTKTGSCYHLESCFYVKNKELKMSLVDATEKYRACSVCHPPIIVSEEGEPLIEKSFTLSGTVGIENLTVKMMSKDKTWTVEDGFDNFAIETTGNFIADASLKGSLDFEISGDDTEIAFKSFDGKENIVTLSALKEKLFPLVFLKYQGTWLIEAGKNAAKVNAPFTIGFMLYTDIEGNISASAEVHCEYNKPLNYRFDIFEDGEFKGLGKLEEKEDEFTWGFKAEVKADVDVQFLGGSVLLYIGNLNVLEFALVQLGAEAEGMIAFDTAELDNGQMGFEVDGGICLYLEMLELNLKMKAATKWGISGEVEAKMGPVFRWDIWTLGTPGKIYPTKYNPNTMYVSNILATDSEHMYYKDERGRLVAKDENNYSKVLYDDKFFVLCGIDETFVYFLKASEGYSSLYDLYRVKKDGTSDRKLREGIKQFLTYDEQYFYFTLGTSSDKIVRLDRATLEEKDIVSFDDPVTLMKQQEEGYHVVTNDGFVLWPRLRYYLIDSEGNILRSYGSSPKVNELALRKYPNYYLAIEYASSGFLRGTAVDTYWMSLDKTTSVITETLSGTGWNYDAQGIYTIHRGTGEMPYQLVLYRAEDGALVRMVDVNNKYTLFTVARDVFGRWYYLDQAEEGITLYTLDRNCMNATPLEFFSKEEFPISLEDCTMMLRDGTIWFYEIPNSKEANVIYKYDLY